MKRTYWSLAAVVLGLAVSANHLPSCGPFFPEAVFTDTAHPGGWEYPRESGELGVIYPSFHRRYLVIAYRELSGKPLAEAERKSEGAIHGPGQEPAHVWLDAKNKWMGHTGSSWLSRDRMVHPDSYTFYLNCSDDALVTAAQTLQDRAGRFPRAQVGQWLAAQETVFENCSQGRQIPAPAEAGLAAVLRKDRDYQIAAAYFYSQQFDEARRRFQAIANDASSSWKAIAPYLAARCLIRKGTIEDDRAALEQADRELAAMKTPAAARLREFVASRLRPIDTLRELGHKLPAGGMGGEFGQELMNYQLLMDRYEGKFAEVRDTSPMTEWIVTFQDGSPESLQHSLERWRGTRSLPWLVASIVKMAAEDTAAKEVMEAAARMDRQSPGWATIEHHRVRLMLDLGQKATARQELDRVLGTPPANVPQSAINLFRRQRMTLAQSFDEFVKLAPRVAIDSRWGGPPPETPLFDDDSVEVFRNGLPLSMWRDAVLSKAMPESLREQLLPVTLARAFVLQDRGVAGALLGQARAFIPEEEAQAYLTATDAESRRFAGALILLRTPGMTTGLEPGIDTRTEKDLRKRDILRSPNWWCEARGERKVQPAAYLTAEQRAALLREWPILSQSPAGPTYMGRIVVNWVRQHPDDPRAPEALYLAVEATHYGCGDKSNGDVSRAAFRLLHQRWPSSEWAKKTPYWFN